LGLVQITQGYVLAKQNSETAQKMQVAMARIVKELSAVCSPSSTNPTCQGITAASGTSVTYTRPASATTSITNTIALSGSEVQIQINNGGASTLIDNVAAFTLAYFDAAGVSTATESNVRRIAITLTVSGANSQSSTLNNSVWIQESY
jgi:hypothetical protein